MTVDRATTAATQSTSSNASIFHGSSGKAVAVYRVVAIYALLVWTYGAMTAVFKLSRLKDPLIGNIAISRTDTSAEAAFIVSALFFFCGELQSQ